MINKTLNIYVLILIGCLGFLLRFYSVKHTQVIGPLRADARDYFMYGYNLKFEHVYSRSTKSLQDPAAAVKPDAIRSPGYPLFLVPFEDRVPTSRTLKKITLAQVIVSSLTLVIAFFFYRMFLPVSWALGACLFTAISPHLIVVNSYVLSETLFCFFLVLFAWTIGWCWKRKSPIAWGAAGAVLGFASLVRPGVQYFPLVMILPFVLEFGRKKGLTCFAMLVLGFALIFSPWIIRNELTMGKASDKTLMINFLHHGMYPNFTYDNNPKSYGFPYRFDPHSKEISKNVGTILEEIGRRFRQEPVRHLKWFLLGKPITLWSWNMIQGMGDVFVYGVSKTPYANVWYFRLTHLLMLILHGPLVILAMVACLLVWFPSSTTDLSHEKMFIARSASLILLYSTFIHIIGAPFPRYSIPLRPIMYGMAVFLPFFLLSLIRKRSA